MSLYARRVARSRTELLDALGDLDAAERAELVAAMAAAAEADADVDDAEGAAETRAAEEAAAQAQAELDAAFTEAGLSPEQGRALMLVVDRAATANTEAAVRRVLDEYVIEGEEPPPTGETGGGPDAPPTPGSVPGRRRKKKPAKSLAELAADPEAPVAPPAPPDEPPEQPPTKVHWFHQPIVRGEK